MIPIPIPIPIPVLILIPIPIPIPILIPILIPIPIPIPDSRLHPCFNQHIQNNSQAIPAAILQQAHQEQLTSDSCRRLSAARSTTNHQRFPPQFFNRQIQNYSPAISAAIFQPPD